MLTGRIIPVLLMQGEDAVKTRQFSQPVYLGDIVNSASIFNSKMVDELVVMDIEATRRGDLNYAKIKQLAEECFMPLCYGGGISAVAQAERLIRDGIEKVLVNTAFHHGGGFVREAADAFGSSSVVVGIDVRRNAQGVPQVFSHSGRTNTGLDPAEQAMRAADAGAGEIILQSIDRDGTRTGFDLPLIRSVAAAVDIPVVALGGADTVEDLLEVVEQADTANTAAGAMFVLYGRLSAVLITYLSQEDRARYRAAAKAASA